MFYKKFVFLKPFVFEGQTLPQNTILTVVNDKIYVNDGQITPVYYRIFEDIIADYMSGVDKTLIKEIVIPYNKI